MTATPEANESEVEPPGKAERREAFAMIPESVIVRTPDDQCLRLYCWLDLRQGARGRPVAGFGTVAECLGWQARTVGIHARHLAEAGVIDLDRRSEHGQAVMRVIHNPGRGWSGPGVDLAERAQRATARSLPPLARLAHQGSRSTQTAAFAAAPADHHPRATRMEETRATRQGEVREARQGSRSACEGPTLLSPGRARSWAPARALPNGLVDLPLPIVATCARCGGSAVNALAESGLPMCRRCFETLQVSA